MRASGLRRDMLRDMGKFCRNGSLCRASSAWSIWKNIVFQALTARHATCSSIRNGWSAPLRPV